MIDRKGLKKVNESDPEWILELAESLEESNVNDLSEEKKRILREQFFEKLREGTKPKEAIEESIEDVSSFWVFKKYIVEFLPFPNYMHQY